MFGFSSGRGRESTVTKRLNETASTRNDQRPTPSSKRSAFAFRMKTSQTAYAAICLLLTGCATAPADRALSSRTQEQSRATLCGSIQLTIEPLTNVLFVTEASDRHPQPPDGVERTGTFPHPDTGWPTTVTGNNIVHFTGNAAQEAQAWAACHACRVDFFACIRNTSTNTLDFYEEWNAWGFDRLKIVCYGEREIWITKQPGIWYRNFPSRSSLRPGEILRIPVAFDDTMWDGVAKAKQARSFRGIRVFYDQLGTPIKNSGDSAELWQGCAFSPPYDIGLILPRRGFKTAEQWNAARKPAPHVSLLEH